MKPFAKAVTAAIVAQDATPGMTDACWAYFFRPSEHVNHDVRMVRNHRIAQIKDIRVRKGNAYIGLAAHEID